MKKNGKAILGILLVFVLGWLAGALTSSVVIAHRALALFKRGPEAMVQVFEKRMTRNLSLDAKQKQEINDYFMQNLAQRLELQKQIQPQIRDLNQDTLKKIDAVLQPEQQTKFHANLDTFKQNAGRFFVDPATPSTNAPTSTPPAK